MGKIKEINGYIRVTIDKSPGIRADLVRLDDNRHDWAFPQMLEALRKWCDRNPLHSSDQSNKSRDRFINSRQEDYRQRPRVYCTSTSHKSVNCDKIASVGDRKKHLSERRLCFNCTGTRHRAADCRITRSCQKCNGRHHTSICDKETQQLLLTTFEDEVIYSVVVCNVNGITCRALLDTGAGISIYIGQAPWETTSKNRVQEDWHDALFNQPKNVQYDVSISSIRGKFEMTTMVSKVDKSVLLSIPNPRYADKIKTFSHLAGVTIDDEDTKPELPIHLILGASVYSRIKTHTKPKIGKAGEPIAELSTLGWAMMSAGKEVGLNSVYLTRTSSVEYQQLCSLDVLGLQDRPERGQQCVYQEFKEQLRWSDEGWYETGLLWKHGHEPLQSNEHGSLRRLENLTKKLQKEPVLLAQYDQIIQDQLETGIVERVTSEPVGREFFIPHKPVIRESAESTKLRIVFDASAKANEKSPSLNDCLETGRLFRTSCGTF